MTVFVIWAGSVIVYALLAVVTARPLYTLRYHDITTHKWGPLGVEDPLPEGSPRAHDEARNYALARAAVWPLTWVLATLLGIVMVIFVSCEWTWNHLHVLRNIVALSYRFISGGVRKVEAERAAERDRIEAVRRAAEDYEDNKRIVAGWSPPPGWKD